MRKLTALLAAALPAIALATVNVNTAQQSELTRIKGLDRVKAKAIIDWRNENGFIDNFTALARVPGFTPEVIERLKPDLAFEGEAYVPPPKPEKKATPRRIPQAPGTR